MLRRILRILRAGALTALTLIALASAVSWIDTKWNNRAGSLWHREARFEWGGPDHRRFCFVICSGQSPRNTPVLQLCLYDRNAPPTGDDWEWSLRQGSGFAGTWSYDSVDNIRDYRETWDVFLAHYQAFELLPSATSRLVEGPRAHFKREYEVMAPAWAPLVVCGAWPALAGSLYVRRRRRIRYRRTHGLCLKCGYNLTGLISRRCPECGAEFSPQLRKVTA